MSIPPSDDPIALRAQLAAVVRERDEAVRKRDAANMTLAAVREGTKSGIAESVQRLTGRYQRECDEARRALDDLRSELSGHGCTVDHPHVGGCSGCQVEEINRLTNERDEALAAVERLTASIGEMAREHGEERERFRREVRPVVAAAMDASVVVSDHDCNRGVDPRCNCKLCRLENAVRALSPETREWAKGGK